MTICSLERIFVPCYKRANYCIKWADCQVKQLFVILFKLAQFVKLKLALNLRKTQLVSHYCLTLMVTSTLTPLMIWCDYGDITRINPVGEPHSDGLNSNLIKHSVQKLSVYGNKLIVANISLIQPHWGISPKLGTDIKLKFFCSFLCVGIDCLFQSRDLVKIRSWPLRTQVPKPDVTS